MRNFGKQLLEKSKKLALKSGVKSESRIVEIRSIRHRIAEKIIETAQDWRAKLIVLGIHGRRGIHRIFLGSVAEGVVRISPVPVLLVRKDKA